MLVVSGGMGAGHDGAARELVRQLGERGVATEVRDFLDALPRPHRPLLKGWHAFTAQYTPRLFDWMARCEERDSVVREATQRVCRTARRAVARWAAGGFDAVVSVFPLATQTLGMLRWSGELGVPVVCCLTDPAPNRLWTHPGVDVYLTALEATATEAAERYGVAMSVGGPLVDPAFRRLVDEAVRRAVRAELGVSPDRLMVLLAAGALGSGEVMASATAVRDVPGTVAVVLCGRNDRLRRKAAASRGVVALGWRDDMPRLLAAADVLVHNAGGLSLTEALVAGVPAVSYRVLAGHGRQNAATLARAGLVPWPRTPEELAEVLRRQASRGRMSLLPTPSPGTAETIEALTRRGRTG
ncbi:glycosyltransferase [Streptomyces luteoverticillatus]|uniref:Glycosyltransferase n=1 Tax=Streptomyces luteoverticillatus TaxID=66425 RepID=A0A3Q9G352_STRLT|nr:glycosyltransferase [Streptomyces luteoverticillatus]AZQ74395.1 glycosyltransferase [Streptomyces luteoverticillatus]